VAEEMVELTDEEYAEYEKWLAEPRYTITFSHDELEYLHMAIHSLLTSQQGLSDEIRNETVSRNDVLESLGKEPETEVIVNLTDVVAKQYVDIKALFAKLRVPVNGDDLTEG
jgi:DNA-directed RNA polymerase subunit F